MSVFRKAIHLTPLAEGFLAVVRYRDVTGKHVESRKVATRQALGDFLREALGKAQVAQELPG